ncbi:hypothetical protein ABZV67_14110 [Streptomyces sp. NPDC005065]
MLRVRKTVGAASDVSVIRSAFSPTVKPGTRITGYQDLVDSDGQPFFLPTDSSEPWILAFQSLGCSGCRQQLPGYRKFLEEQGIPEERAVSISIGDPTELGWLKEGLRGAGRMVHVEQDSPLVTGLQITTWPTYLVVGADATVAYAAQSSARLSTFSLRRPSRAVIPVPG